ncbi:MAG: YicC family protein [bacterium]|nr:YicC family protein [bacterium]
MIRSMTGYGQGAADLPGARISVELRSVNNRFVDVRLRLPGELSALEAQVRRRVLTKVRRGRVDLTVRLEQAAGGEVGALLDEDLVGQVLAAARALREQHGVTGEPDVATLLRVPGVLRTDPSKLEWGEAERKALFAALDQALEALDAERLREGANLQAELLEVVENMTRLAAAIRSGAGRAAGLVQQRLTQRLSELAGEVALDPARLAQEAAILADRSDVTEEVVRLDGHLEQARELLASPDGDPVGKRLDFLLQEIHRETNTTSSKSSDLELTRTALALKADVEKVREQLQNLE